MRDAGEVDLAFQRVDATCRAVEHPVESFGVNGAPVGLSVSIGVDEEADLFRLLRHPGNRIFPVPLLVHPATVFHAEGGDVVGVPVAVIAVVGNAVTQAVSLGHEDSPGLVDTESGRRVDVVFVVSSEDLEPAAFGNSDARQGVGAHQSGIEGPPVPGGTGKAWIGFSGEEDVVDQDIVALPGRGINQAQAALLSLQVAHIPGAGSQDAVVLASGLPHDLVTDEELDGCQALLAPASYEEADVGVFDGKGGRGEGAHPGSSFGEGTGEGFTGVAPDLVSLSPVSAGGRSLSKGLPGLLPGPEPVTLKGFKDPVSCLEMKGKGQCDEGRKKDRHRSPEGSSSFGNRKVWEPILWREECAIADYSG